MNNTVSFEVIEQFLEGKDPQKYIVAIESSYRDNVVDLVINDPETGKRIEKHSYKPFVWLKHEVSILLYGGKSSVIKAAMSKYKVKIKKLRVENDEGVIPDRLDNGYKFIATCDGSYSNLINFFREGGVDLYSSDNINPSDADSPTFRSLFVAFSPDEQFLIQSGKRLFKGMDEYNDLHRFQFDLETEGLDASVNAIFQIGMRDNRGYEEVLETKGDSEKEKRDSERNNIIRFFHIIDEKLPDLITAYNDANFDWPFIKRRCERLGIDITNIAKTLSPKKKIRWKDTMLKLGGETEFFEQTLMWGYNVLDISHAVRRAQAINSDIKSWSLKYITQYSGVAKKNRVYVPGDILNKTWLDTSDYAFNDTNGDWYRVSEDKPLDEGYEVVKGDYIVQRYLLDDLWETDQVDAIYNQASYLIAKLLPTSYMRSSTMGTAGQWKLIMGAWSYENGLGIPSLEKKRDFTGGLSRLLEVGYARNVAKLDFAALYPKTQLTHDIFPSLDISGVMKGLLTYVVDKRDEFKFKTGEEKSITKDLQKKLDDNLHRLTPDRVSNANKMISEHKKLASDYDKKQLPLKILANSFFGAYGAPYIFNWGDSDCAEETTCRGRQYLRLMVKHFYETHGFRPLVGDTDGFNFAMPDNINTIKYVAKGSHWKTSKYEPGTELSGLDAVLADFNETYMIGRMGLDIDDVCNSTINFARKNYANDIDGKIKLVGNSIKSKAMPVYIEEFLNKAIRLLLDGKGYEFILWYYEYVNKIYNYEIPVAKIASKSKVKLTPDNYKNVYCRQKNKAGNLKSRQAHMELILANDLNVNLGDVIYYVNTGTAKSHADVKTIKDKKTKQVLEVLFNCKMIPQSQLDSDPDYTTDEYNVAKYLDAFNKRIKPLLVCFSTEIRSEIIIDVYKDKKTKLLKLEENNAFTRRDCELVAGKPFEDSDQDSYEALMTLEDKELRFWDSVDKIPNNMSDDDWSVIRADYKERKRIERIEGINEEKVLLDNMCMRLEVDDYDKMKNQNKLPNEILSFCDLFNVDDRFVLTSNKWGVELADSSILLKYEPQANERLIYYNTLLEDVDDKYQQWVDYKESINSHKDPETVSQNMDELKADMIKFLEDNYWEMGYDGSWIRKDWDYNQTGSFTLEKAYEIEMSYQNNLDKAKNQKPDDLIIKYDND